MGKNKRLKAQRSASREASAAVAVFESVEESRVPISEVATRAEWIVRAFVWLIPFALYVTTSSRTPLSCGDSLEFVTASFTQGVAHAPGYPLLSLLGKIVATVVPVAVALRYGIFSAFLGASVVLLIYLFVRRLFGSRDIALVCAFTYAFSYHHWFYSLVTEVSGLSALFGTLLPLILWCAHQDRVEANPAKLYFWAQVWMAVYGLSFTHHYLILFYLPGALWFARAQWNFGPASFDGRQWRVLLLWFLAGLIPILYLPYCALGQPLINSGNVTSVGNLLRLIARSDYSNLTLTTEGAGLSSGAGVSSAIIGFYFDMVARSFTWVGLALFTVGLGALWRCHRSAFRLLVPSFLLAGIGFFLLARMPPNSIATKLTLEKFLSISFVILPVFLGALLHLAARKSRLLVWVAGILPVVLLVWNYPFLNFRNFRASEQFGEDLLKSVEPNSILIIHGDAPLFLTMFMQQVEQRRPDIKLISHSIAPWHEQQLRDRYPDLTIPASAHGMGLVKEIIAANIDRFPIFEHGIPGEQLAESGMQGTPFFLQPHGLAYKVTRTFDPNADDGGIWKEFEIQSKLAGPLVQNFCVSEINEMYMMALHNRGAFFYLNKALAKAIQYTKQALQFDPDFVPTRQALVKMRAEATRKGISE